jgi:hypothetical protein
MRQILALAATAMLGLSAPALAQSVGAPGATGTGGPLTGSNPPGSGVDPQWTYNEYGPGYAREYGDYGPGYAREDGPGDYDSPNGYDQPPGYLSAPRFVENRPYDGDYAQPPLRDGADPTPRTVRGDQNGQDQDY